MASWIKLEDNWYVCEYGCFNSEGYKEEHCNHSSDCPDDSDDNARMNAAHWRRAHPDPKGIPHGFLCNYHYEELVLGLKHPMDEEIEPEAAGFEALSAEDFSAGIGEMK